MPQTADQRAARDSLTRILRAQPENAQALMALGDVYRDWPVIGRYRAWELYGHAADLLPHDPAPRYGQVQVGLFLRRDDGERMIRDAIFRILAITADYRDIWGLWDRMYHGDGHRRRAVELLARHHTAVAVRRRAMLLLELERFVEAGATLDSALRANPEDGGLLALRAEAAFGVEDTALGLERYAAAVRLAAFDPGHILWRQVESIASPDEEVAWVAASAFERPAFFTGFWARREPDLTTAVNERIIEHFARLRYVRDHFRLQHPMSDWHYSALNRALGAQEGARIVAAGLRDAPRAVRSEVGVATADQFDDPSSAVRPNRTVGVSTLPGRSFLDEDLQDAGVFVDVRDLPEPDTVTRYARMGFDGRGLLWMRYGRPPSLFIANDKNAEAWGYVIDGTAVQIQFGRTAGGGGDVILSPIDRRALRNAVLALERDRSAMPARRAMRGWVAWFRDERDGYQDVWVAATADSIAAAALDERTGVPVDRRAGGVPLQLVLPAGRYALGVDSRNADGLARLRTPLVIPRLGGWLSISSILVRVGADTAGGRAEFAAAMPPSLVLDRAGAPITLYTEVYDLLPRDGLTRYEVRYTFESGHGDPIVFAFDRVRRAAPTAIERLTLQPGDLPAGTYRITIAVLDRELGLQTTTSRVDVTLR